MEEVVGKERDKRRKGRRVRKGENKLGGGGRIWRGRKRGRRMRKGGKGWDSGMVREGKGEGDGMGKGRGIGRNTL